MPEAEAIPIIRSIQKKWTLNALLSYFLLSLAITVLLVTVMMKFAGLSVWWGIPVLLVSFVSMFWLYRSWKVSENEVTRFLNQQFPQLEESTALLLKPAETLNLLERLQVKKIRETIGDLPGSISFNKGLKRPAIILAVIAAVSTALFLVPVKADFLKGISVSNARSANIKPEIILPNISSVQVTIKSPAYTGKGSKTQSLFNIKAEEGSDIQWQLQTTVQVDSLQLILNGTTRVPLSSQNNDGRHWTVSKNFISPGFYQVKIDQKLSELYSIDLVKDGAPTVLIQKPKAYTVIEYGQPLQVPMTVAIEDDYGIKETDILVTIAVGTGEGVKFTEKKLTFGDFRSGGRKYSLQKTLDLPALGLKPGDELYFFVRTVDNYNQESRSDVHMISIPDTAELMSLEGLAAGVNVKPEYFRSQRQIIIETEQLLRDQKTMTAEAFRDKANDLGIDQKLLRMRYSKFLGEESEGEEGHDHENEDNHSDAADFGNAKKIMEHFSHEHDNAEDGALFDSQTKKQLQEILSEMWNSEKHLRTIQPKDALPFEYKALRLLKDLQEKSRSYVAKAGFKTTPLKPEKRLTADLSKIIEPQIRTDIKKKDNPDEEVRRALGILENLKAGAIPDASSLATLQQAGLQLNRRASAEPTAFLSSVGAMNRVLETTGRFYSALDLSAAQKGLARLVKAPTSLPSPETKSPDQNLSQQYFKNLPR
ncbi:MAG: hypothetical protein ABI151_00400 [Chitinophagaceae bacterium]